MPKSLNNEIYNAGTSQKGRLISALMPDYVSLADYSIEYWIDFAKKLSKEIKYYDFSNNESGSWENFLKEIDPKEVAKLLEEMSEINILPEYKYAGQLSHPHRALFFSFLLLLKYPQKQLADFTNRHLNYYYRECLQLKERPAVPNQVHVTFKLAEDKESYLIKKGTALSAGEDINGNDIIYHTNDDLLANHAEIAKIKTISNLQNLIFTDVFNKEDSDDKGAVKRFKTMGEVKSAETCLEIPTGFVIGSPLLFLKSGERVITLTFTFTNNDGSISADIFNKAFKFYTTGAEGWMELDSKILQSDGIAIELLIPPSAPAIVAPKYPPNTGLDGNYPQIKVILNNPERYGILKKLKLQQIKLDVKVAAIKDLKMRNDLDLLPSNTLMIHPFSLEPIKNSAFYFTHEEIISKPLSSLTLNWTWTGLPQDFAQYYATYKTVGVIITPVTNKSFTRKLSSYGKEISTQGSISFFSSTLSPEGKIEIGEVKGKNYDLKLASDDDPLTSPAYFKLTLDGSDFLHSLHVQALTAAAILNAQNQSKEPIIINPPYTPTWSNVSVSYTASETLSLNNNKLLQLIRTDAFGYKSITADDAYLLPQYDDQGAIFLGFNKLQHGGSLSLLWEFAQYPHSMEMQPVTEVKWSYLADNKWKEDGFKPKHDTTNDLSNSGIISFDIPADITSQNSVMKEGLYWLKATVVTNNIPDTLGTVVTNNIPDTLGISTQGVAATFAGQNEEQDVLAVKLLAAHSITELLEPDSSITAVMQPYDSFGGYKSQSKQAFWVSTSERLRHKGRAITFLDYERLVLDAFPEIHKVRCFKAGDAKVKLVIITNTEPQSGSRLTLKILSQKVKDYLSKRTSPFVQVEVTGPNYEKVRYEVEVRFNLSPALDIDIQKKKLSAELNSDLKKFLLPFVYGDIESLSSEDTIYNTSVINFIKSKPYIDQVLALKAYIDHKGIEQEVMNDFVSPSSPEYILISADEHKITEALYGLSSIQAHPNLRRHLHSSCAVKRDGEIFIYVIGGFFNNKVLDSIEVYDYAMNRIETKDTLKLNPPRMNHSSCVVGNEIYVIGGLTDSGKSHLNNVQIFNLDNNQWREGPTLKHGRYSHSSCTVKRDGKTFIYVIGGKDKEDKILNSVEFYVPEEGDKWKDAPNLNKIRHSHSSCAVNSKIYVIGGTGLHQLASIEIYDPKDSEKWTEKEDFLSNPSYGHSSCVVGNEIYVIGGQLDNNIKRVEVYDSITLNKIRTTNTKKDRVFHSACEIGNKIYVIGSRGGDDLVEILNVF